MLKIENFEEFNIHGALRGMRNPLNSWGKSSADADLDLAKRLYKAGSEHRKYLRQIFISMDITAPLYWKNSNYESWECCQHHQSEVKSQVRWVALCDFLKENTFLKNII